MAAGSFSGNQSVVKKKKKKKGRLKCLCASRQSIILMRHVTGPKIGREGRKRGRGDAGTNEEGVGGSNVMPSFERH